MYIITEENTDDKSPSLSGPSNIALTTKQTRTTRLLFRIGQSFGSHSATSLPPPSILSPLEKRMRVLRFIARLRQPFGAMLLTATRRNIDEYKRIATERLIRVQVEEITQAILDRLIDSVRILDVL